MRHTIQMPKHSFTEAVQSWSPYKLLKMSCYATTWGIKMLVFWIRPSVKISTHPSTQTRMFCLCSPREPTVTKAACSDLHKCCSKSSKNKPTALTSGRTLWRDRQRIHRKPLLMFGASFWLTDWEMGLSHTEWKGKTSKITFWKYQYKILAAQYLKYKYSNSKTILPFLLNFCHIQHFSHQITVLLQL